jgi:hypothetical protein
MIILGVGAFGEPYKVEIDDDTLFDIVQARKVLRKLPWNGQMFIPLKAKALGSGGQRYLEESVEAVVTKTIVWVKVDGPEGWENILDPNEDLLSLKDDVHISKSFEDELNEMVFNLSQDEIDLVERWKAHRTKNSKKS